MKTLSQRMQILPANFFAALEARIVALQAAGKEVIRLDIGSPDLPPAPHILQALSHSAAAPDSHGYQAHISPVQLRRAWAEMYGRLYGVELDENSEVLPLLGSKEGIFNLIQAWIDPGEVVLAPDPGYMTYTRGTLFAGGQPHPVPLLPERGYLPDFQSVPAEVLRCARMLWLNYPNNPTAAVASLEFFAEAVAFARKHDLLLCHDAAYSQVTFNGRPAPSVLQIPGAKQTVVEFNSLSKSHNMPGWRLGVAVGNADALRALFKLKTNVDSGHFLPVMEAAAAALNGDQSWLVDRNEIYRQRRDIVIAGLRAMGLLVAAPQASIYVWSPTPPGWSSLDFVTALLEETQVSLTPGVVFGGRGEGHVRIALTTATDRLEEAMQRLAQWRKT